MKDYLPFGLLTSYLVWWRFALVTVGSASLPYLVWYRNHWKSSGVNWIPRDITMNIQSFGSISICVVCDIDKTGTRASKLATKWKNSVYNSDFEDSLKNTSCECLPFGLLTSYFVWWRFALVTVGRVSLPYLVCYIHRWKKLRCKLNIQRLYE